MNNQAERRQLERDLNRGVREPLVLAALKVRSLSRYIEQDPDAAGQLANEIRAELDLAIEALRHVAVRIYPTYLDYERLARLAESAQAG
jgi:signal transduction histidine kinase